MKRTVNFENDAITFHPPNGKRLTVAGDMVRAMGIKRVFEVFKIADQLPTERFDLFQDGRKIGTLPPDFDPLFVKSKTFLYQVRQGDFTFDNDKWIADRTLCPGDLEAVPGFQWERSQ